MSSITRTRGYLPSIESQTMAFVARARLKDQKVAEPLEWKGFYVYLRYWRNGYLPPPLDNLEVIVIAAVEVPKRYSRRGWFWRYCQLCALLTQGGVAIESVHNPHLRKALQRRPEFVEYQENNFYLLKRFPGDWPLMLG